MAKSSTQTTSDEDLQRRHGVYYTPAQLAEWMVRVSLETLLSHGEIEGRKGEMLSILDPACGAGVFLEQGAKWVRENSPEGMRWAVCGVDRDAEAIVEARKSLSRLSSLCQGDTFEAGSNAPMPTLLRDVGMPPEELANDQWRSEEALKFEIVSRVVVGDALLRVDWSQEFLEVQRHGGFDLILGNPPYRREKDAREQFEEIAASPLGKKWRQARMDLWYYFLHRSLDLLSPRGLLCFVVNSYWTHSRGAQKLIARLRAETDLLRIVDFDQWPVFAGVQGRHHVFWLRKKRAGEEPRCCVFQILKARRRGDSLQDVWRSLEKGEPRTEGEVTWTAEEYAQRELYHGGQLIPHRSVGPSAASRVLEEFFEVRQGVAENPPVVSKRQAALFPELGPAGRGVFVLSPEEVAELNLSEAERRLLRPYWETSEVGRYREPVDARKQILYLTGKTAPRLEEMPMIARHLEQFRPLLDARREVRQGKIPWWHLHWPREERLFVQPRIVAVQMGKRPRFVYTEAPAVVGFSCHVIVAREGEEMPLQALCGVLNSASAQRWFETFAKRRGVHLEISGETLRRFPLPGRDAVLEQELVGLVERRQGAEDARVIDELEQEINKLVRDWMSG